MNTYVISCFRSEKLWRYLLSFILSAVFIVAGVLKLAAPAAFTQDILSYRMLSETWSTFFAASLPWLEIMAGGMLFVRPFRLSASFVMVGMMTVFTLAVALALARGLDISCGCFGKAFEEYGGSGLTFLLRDLVLLTASGILFWLTVKKESEQRLQGE